ncbi:Ribosome recycling factor [Candidatus Protochlamydia naegleriophila]|uniref:Ribosome-recycling factor n=1 Tax=Candidatus Protochlamydia naegleriophila TaxID=389348 RepID=A0A0U5JF98_9BACT|nr:ribosome recycling factor [Candidatus Protochlamydia naegleriophila]CUI17847.1 Ribosome recycling factor [Candidatus Protochlamydia naegleriophila]
MSILDQTRAKMLAAIEHLKNDLKNIRTGRANPGIVEHVMVEVYGSPMRLKDIASISAPEARQLLITPFDPQNANTVGKAIEKANLGLMPIVDGHAIRIKIPPMTEEIRKKMAKICHEEKEKTKVSIRNIRRDSNELARKQKADGDIAEDAMKKLEKSIQELTDKFCKEADELAEKKEKEISTI